MDNKTTQQGNIDPASQQSSGSNARRISSTFKKKLNIEPRAVTGNIDERDSNVLNLKSEQKRIEAEKRNQPDIYDEKIVADEVQSKQRIDEEKLRQSGPEDEDEAIAATQQIYDDEALAVNQKLIQSLKSRSDYLPEKPQAPQFPVIMFTFAIMKDFFDFFLTLGIETIVFIIIAEIFSTLFGIAIFIWLLNKSQLNNRKIFKKQVKGAIGTMLLELIPLIQVLPMESIFIYWTYRKESKEYEAELRAAQKLKELQIVRK